MRAVNHAMTGAIIGLSMANPVALPLAFVSHYILDAIPHHDPDPKKKDFSKKSFLAVLITDALLCLALVVLIFVKHPQYWWLAILCAFLAASPDFVWFQDFQRARRGDARKDPKLRHDIVRLHAWLQWFQRPIGFIVEVAWALAAIIFLFFLLKS